MYSAKKRKYFNSCLSMGFAQESDEISPRPVCVLCNEVLQSTSSVPSRLNRPSEIQHSKQTCKLPSFFHVMLSNPLSGKVYTHTQNSDLKMKMHLWFL
jgi:hypothetical protein